MNMMARRIVSLVFTAAFLILSGCAGTSPGKSAHGQQQAMSGSSSLSLSMTRTFPVTRGPATSVPRKSTAANLPDQSPEMVGTETRSVNYSYLLQKGDPLVIHLRGIYPQDQEVEDIIDDNGNVSLPFLGDIPASGRPTSDLEAYIRDSYITGGYYRNITVSVVMPQKTYFIRGEVKSPGRFPVVGGLTMLQAIAAAGGYTEFANPKKVSLIRGGRTSTINMRDIERKPEQDIRLESGDVIVVERSLF